MRGVDVACGLSSNVRATSGPAFGLLEQDVRETPAEPADHGAGPEQGSNDDGEQAKKVRDSLTHDP